MSLALRTKAAKLIAKLKVLLLKEVPISITRVNKWEEAIDAAEEMKTNKVQAASQAEDCSGKADNYKVAIGKMSKAVGKMAILTESTTEIKAFVEKIKKYRKAAGDAYDWYEMAKDRYFAFVVKGSIDDKLFTWLQGDEPQWDMAEGLLKPLIPIAVEIARAPEAEPAAGGAAGGNKTAGAPRDGAAAGAAAT